MKTKLKTLLIACLAVSVMPFASCKKYEDGPVLSTVSRSERVANTWIIAFAKENDENVSDQYDQYELYLTSEGDAELNASYTAFGTEYVTSTTGYWSFQDDDEVLVLDFEDDDQDGRYKILRLTTDELWLHDTQRDLELHLLEK